MTTQEYLQSLLSQQSLNEQELEVLRNLRDQIEAVLAELEGRPRFYYGGSYGKKTIISERYDLDIVIYWPQNTNYTVESIYRAVGKQLKKEWDVVKPKTVSWEIPFEGGFHIDVVPGRALAADYREANLYRTDTGTTLKTSLKTHIDTVRNSGRRDAIRLLKLWRERNQVPFKKSFLLEMMTIEGSKGRFYTDLEGQFLSSLTYIKDHIETVQVKDPANSNNSLSDDIPGRDKQLIKRAAQDALNAKYWSQIFGN
ncbi:nucleotidyltransferase [Trichocoleus sp. FACHB-262]|uniref:nucleotidyltransferase domain-containing protein n=1 Tax=Trichocoleus sp. FACHB-262 TaxID=2692869 RepID=UPI001686BC2F|nr:nucleotidyltransferase [Trichocoleus sp. FACHB-262]MBD2122163.1 nucleotidyltransferase [Trichocoleus sp. FACHB-262]